jgi:hypothetical protein
VILMSPPSLSRHTNPTGPSEVPTGAEGT